MSRIRAAAAVTALGAFLLVGFGAATAHAGNRADAADHADSSVVSNSGSGNIMGNVNGNAVNTQQTATGSGAGNQDNGLAVAGNTGSVSSQQSNSGGAGPDNGGSTGTAGQGNTGKGDAGRGNGGKAGTGRGHRTVDDRVYYPHVLY
ncbi:hypothetical protein AB0E96_21385 [Kitasatospora sp. NPDC036755]|uniref:hypothetical protein n=1 Tax=Kitasatospora sp. NPDC036755 TaxID=3154600 RepID=UPI0033FB5F85